MDQQKFGWLRPLRPFRCEHIGSSGCLIKIESLDVTCDLINFQLPLPHQDRLSDGDTDSLSVCYVGLVAVSPDSMGHFFGNRFICQNQTTNQQHRGRNYPSEDAEVAGRNQEVK